MNEGDLPDDLDAWPKDPYRILGVSRTSSEKEVRLAYAALVRRFKPEHHPEHFRRIREAYDLVKTWLPWAAADQAHPGEWTAAPTPAAVDELTEADQAIRAGHEQDAYETFSRLAAQGVRPALALRLYWMLELWSHLNPEEEPAEWLVRALKQQPDDYRCRDAYRLLVDRRPEEAFTSRFADWLATQSGLNLFQALTWRWHAAATLGRWNIPAEDLHALPQLRHDELVRARLIFLALDYLMWRKEGHLIKACAGLFTELEASTHLHTELQNEFHRLDVLRDLCEGVEIVEDQLDQPALAGLIRQSWVRPVIEQRQRLLAYIALLLEDPRAALAEFDQVHQRAPVVLGQFLYLLESLRQMQRRWNDQPAPAPLARTALEFLWRPANVGEPFRFRILDFCLEEFVEAPYLVSILPFDRLSDNERHMLLEAHEDAALTCVVRAYIVFHS